MHELKTVALIGQEQHNWEEPRITVERYSDHSNRIKALGNAVVPQQVYPILAAIAAIERETKA